MMHISHHPAKRNRSNDKKKGILKQYYSDFLSMYTL